MKNINWLDPRPRKREEQHRALLADLNDARQKIDLMEEDCDQSFADLSVEDQKVVAQRLLNRAQGIVLRLDSWEVMD